MPRSPSGPASGPLTRIEARALCEAGYMTVADYIAFCATEQAKFMAEDSKIMESEIDVAFKSLEKSKLQNSALPPTVITALMPIIKDK